MPSDLKTLEMVEAADLGSRTTAELEGDLTTWRNKWDFQKRQLTNGMLATEFYQKL